VVISEGHLSIRDVYSILEQAAPLLAHEWIVEVSVMEFPLTEISQGHLSMRDVYSILEQAAPLRLHEWIVEVSVMEFPLTEIRFVTRIGKKG
jgi:hypothetical protein